MRCLVMLVVVVFANVGLTRESIAQIVVTLSQRSRRNVEHLQGHALDQLVDWQIERMPLSAFCQAIERSHRINVHLDTKALESSGVSRDSPVTISISGAPLRVALRTALGPYGLTSLNLGELLRITTVEDADSRMVSEVYPVRDLIAKGGFQRTADMRSLVDTIKAVTGSPLPGWLDNGGVGDVKVLVSSLSLVIVQTPDVHEQIDEVLSGLRRSRRVQGLSTLPIRALPSKNCERPQEFPGDDRGARGGIRLEYSGPLRP